MTAPAHEQGAALLTVLIIVGIIAALAVASFERLRLATLLGGNAGGQEQARSFAGVAEALVAVRIDDLLAASPARTTLAGGWQGREQVLPLPGGLARATVRDGGNCFNLNSLVTGTPPDGLVTRPLAVEQFQRLMAALAVPAGDARRIAAAAADWIDSDSTPNPDGAEDSVYARAATPYRTANTLMAEASELRAVAGVTPALYARLRPWLCALPETELSPINVNTLVPAQAPLLEMLFPATLGAPAARAVIGERPQAGWTQVEAFWNTPTLRDYEPPGDVLRQPRVKTGWFALDLGLVVGDSELRESALVDARVPPARIASRRWTRDE
ncbi:MAG: general secretion pathway protein GspK [Alphaproteobacteria bacterium PA4]|nr:MAG: general secretion pathway protein GspK [Alphaproteobacteria bacterium PA4]